MNICSRIICVLLSMLVLSCNTDKVYTTILPPEIVVEDSGVYTTKVGRAVELEPYVKSADGAIFGWYERGVKVGDAPIYTFVSQTAGTYYLTLRVENISGRDEADFRVEVYDLMPPKISFLAKNGVIEIVADVATQIEPQIFGAEGATFRWSLDGEPCGGGSTCIVNISDVGDHLLTLVVENEDGSDEESVTLRVVERASASAIFPSVAGLSDYQDVPVRKIPLGRSITLTPTLEGFSTPTYRWRVGAAEVGSEALLCFEPTDEGEFEVSVEVSDSDGYRATASVVVVCCASEGTYRRAASTTSSNRWSKIYEYTPAPGQYIGESKSGFDGQQQSLEQAVAYAESRLSSGRFLSLGGWGGYVVAGFDHSIANGEGADFSIYGNMYATSNEAGIVWVMQDSDGNGLPDDEWYELRGSEWGGENHTTRYAVTYFRPAGEQMPICWRDNCGGEGVVPRMPAHVQASYFPEWIEADHYTLYGSRLAMNTSTLASGVVSHNPYAWGYADNQGEDCDAGPDVADENSAVACHFDISNAVTADGRAVALQYIDFVRVQSSINGYDDAMGELSTEVLGIEAR